MPLNTEYSGIITTTVTRPPSPPKREGRKPLSPSSSSSSKLESKEHWEDTVENDRPHEGDIDNSNNWSWHELGNEQCQIVNAPNSSLPNLPPEDTTPNIIRDNREAELALQEMTSEENTNKNANVERRSSYDELERI
ncbi:2048_t:CDS:2 [Ambispora leptoticha]|uniref:2048_t:CDS:1 n=1 Tax=Ambispora leptoticha TaxID=144679 RepID=A0A9N8WHK8_9GLOM|nr:2048_t:CDS:2 [Ambispora leptoticha]